MKSVVGGTSVVFFISRLLQGAGLMVIAVNFLKTFPGLMSPKIFLTGIGLFVVGWLLQRFIH